MAKFTKLNIGDAVASSGGRVWKKLSSMLQLSAPTLSLDGDTLTITDDSSLAETFAILADGEQVTEVVARSSWSYATNTERSITRSCHVGDTLVAAILTRDTLTVSDGWTLISTSEINSADTSGNGQRLSWAYKVAESESETLTVTQASNQIIGINIIILTGLASLVDNGYSYRNNADGNTITVNKPRGLVLWGVCAPKWSTSTYWAVSNNIPTVQAGIGWYGRLAIGYDATDEATVTFTADGLSVGSTIIVGCLSVRR